MGWRNADWRMGPISDEAKSINLRERGPLGSGKAKGPHLPYSEME